MLSSAREFPLITNVSTSTLDCVRPHLGRIICRCVSAANLRVAIPSQVWQLGSPALKPNRRQTAELLFPATTACDHIFSTVAKVQVWGGSNAKNNRGVLYIFATTPLLYSCYVLLLFHVPQTSFLSLVLPARFPCSPLFLPPTPLHLSTYIPTVKNPFRAALQPSVSFQDVRQRAGH